LEEPTQSVSTVFSLEDYLGETKRSWSESEQNVTVSKIRRFVGRARCKGKVGSSREEARTY